MSCISNKAVATTRETLGLLINHGDIWKEAGKGDKALFYSPMRFSHSSLFGRVGNQLRSRIIDPGALEWGESNSIDPRLVVPSVPTSKSDHS
jgi:hypothetical protein